MIRSAHADGIRTFVLGIAGMGDYFLQEAANAGQGVKAGQPDAKYFTANTAQDLRDAFQSIIGAVASCELAIDGAVDPQLADSGTVKLDGELLKYDLDWTVVSSTTLRLEGAACEKFKASSTAHVEATFPLHRRDPPLSSWHDGDVDSVRIEYQGNSVEMPFGETVIGRDVGCALRFNDPAVSRKHLRFIRRHDEVFVEDLGSSNGTLLNNRRVAAALRLVDGDLITFGNRELTIRITDSELDDRPTLVLTNLHALEEPAEAPRAAAPAAIQRSVTAPMAIPTVTLAHQRCPSCAAPVTELDDQCSSCGYNWGSFRPMSRTDMRPASLDRRRHDRQPVALHLVYASSELEIEATTRDLSESGVFVCSQVLDPIGTRCSLTILVDFGPPLAIAGVVRRVVEHADGGSETTGLGVQFVNVGPGELAWIRAVIERSSVSP